MFDCQFRNSVSSVKQTNWRVDCIIETYLAFDIRRVSESCCSRIHYFRFAAFAFLLLFISFAFRSFLRLAWFLNGRGFLLLLNNWLLLSLGRFLRLWLFLLDWFRNRSGPSL